MRVAALPYIILLCRPFSSSKCSSLRPISVQCPPLELSNPHPAISPARTISSLPIAHCPCLRFLIPKPTTDGLVNWFIYKRACQSRPLHLSSPMLHQFHQSCIGLNGSLQNRKSSSKLSAFTALKTRTCSTLLPLSWHLHARQYIWSSASSALSTWILALIAASSNLSLRHVWIHISSQVIQGEKKASHVSTTGPLACKCLVSRGNWRLLREGLALKSMLSLRTSSCAS